MLTGFTPVADECTRLLVLGSFPSVASLGAGQYYAHPRNQFWKILSALFGTDLVGMAYEGRLHCVLEHGLGIWDVYAECEREGSLDSAIAQARFNDFGSLVARLPRLVGIAHNGGESARARRFTGSFGVPVYRLPSTSPANASWSFERKCNAWREVFAQCGLVAPLSSVL
jgi:hypoxanthine-DNA glycosylase